MIISKSGAVLANATQPTISFAQESDYNAWVTEHGSDINKFVIVKAWLDLPALQINGNSYGGSDIVTGISSTSTDNEVPTAKAMYTVVGNIESVLDIMIGE